MNLSDIGVVDPALYGRTSFSINEILRDWCTQIDGKIVLCCFLILTGYVVIKIAPYSLKGFPLHLRAMLEKPLERFVSLTETLSLGGAVLIIIFAYVQYGFTPGYYIWAGLLLVFMVLGNIARFWGEKG